VESSAAEGISARDGAVSFLIDTDTCSAHLKEHRAVTGRFLQYTGRLYISAITVGELFTWAERSGAPPRRMQSLLDLLNDMTVLSVTEQVGRKYGELRAALFDAGKPAPDIDLLIASTAIVHDLTLVTHNVKDFANITDLRIVDWVTSN
jgi:tRNA(fMet)-specific endonuclease VapC